MINFFRSLYDKENNEDMYIFNIAHTICIVGMVMICCIVSLFFENPRAVFLTFGTTVLFVLTMAEANRTHKVRRCVIFMSIIFNFIYMPEIFYMFGRNVCVIPLYFLFGLMYSMILIDTKTAIILGFIETVYYVAILITADRFIHVNISNMTKAQTENSYIAAIVAVLVVGICSGATVRFRFMAYKKEQEKAELMKTEAMDAYVAKDMFLINMSHEIRTPMNAIVGTVDLLLDHQVNEHVSDSIYNILNSCNALLSITDELMDLSKAENGEIELFASTYDLSDLLMEVINMMTVRLTESNLSFYVDINSRIPRFLYGDSAKLRQLFVNILNNALKFTPAGRIVMRVDHNIMDNDSTQLIVDIEDTGIGIKKEEMTNLFKRNASDEISEDSDTIDGSGLGLSICAQIIEEMKGKISVQSEYQKGSTFTFKVPQRFTSMDTVAYIPDAHLYNVLIFEKDEENAQHVKKILDDFGVTSDIARTGSDIERLLNVNKYTHVFAANERHEECDTVLERRLVNENIVTFLNIDDNVHISKATTILTRPIHTLNIASLLRNEMNSYVREVNRKGGFECPHATLLVVDDNFTNLNVASAILQKYGANVLTALSGKDCLRILNDHEVDLVFLDYMMPEMNGIDTLEHIRKLPGSKFAALPVVALTANVVSGAREMFLEAGFDDFLAKPISIDRMEKVLRKYLPKEHIIQKS